MAVRMQDVNSEHWCDFSIESIGDYEPSHTSNMVDAPFQYRIAVRQHYTTWQIIKLRLQSKKAHPQMEQSNGVTIDTNTELQEYINKATTEALENYNDKR